MAKVLDPVCGMTIESTTASRSTEYEGETYYFCAPGCHKAFERNPQQFLATAEESKQEKEPIIVSGNGPSCSCCQ